MTRFTLKHAMHAMGIAIANDSLQQMTDWPKFSQLHKASFNRSSHTVVGKEEQE